MALSYRAAEGGPSPTPAGWRSVRRPQLCFRRLSPSPASPCHFPAVLASRAFQFPPEGPFLEPRLDLVRTQIPSLRERTMAVILLPSVYRTGVGALVVGLAVIGGAVGAGCYFGHHVWTALQGPTPVSLEDIAALEDPRQLPSTWVQVKFDNA